jgi:chromosome segregation ATPase
MLQTAQSLETELTATRAMLDAERQERLRIVDSLKGTIQRVRDAGQEEQRLQAELQRNTDVVSEQRGQLEARERAALVAADELNRTHADLSEVTAKFTELQAKARNTEREASKKDQMARSSDCYTCFCQPCPWRCPLHAGSPGSGRCIGAPGATGMNIGLCCADAEDACTRRRKTRAA